MKRVLLVCTGNICRSPLAAAMLRRMAAERGLEGLVVQSAGTSAWEGASASEGSYLIALEKGLDLSDHAARPLTSEMVAAADLVFGMSTQHVERAEALGGAGKSFLLGEYAGLPPEEAVVDDPFGGDLEDYRVTYDQLEPMLRAAIDRLAESRSSDDGADGN